jgi:hypothetical protein
LSGTCPDAHQIRAGLVQLIRNRWPFEIARLLFYAAPKSPSRCVERAKGHKYENKNLLGYLRISHAGSVVSALYMMMSTDRTGQVDSHLSTNLCFYVTT